MSTHSPVLDVAVTIISKKPNPNPVFQVFMLDSTNLWHTERLQIGWLASAHLVHQCIYQPMERFILATSALFDALFKLAVWCDQHWDVVLLNILDLHKAGHQDATFMDKKNYPVGVAALNYMAQ